MGQYHKLVNLDKREYVEPYGLGLGAKQYEQVGGFDGSLADAQYLLTMTSPARGGGDFPMTDVSARWAGDRVVVVGDYSADEDLPTYFKFGEVYAQCNDKSETFEDITPMIRDAFFKIFQIEYEEKVNSFGGGTSWVSIQRSVLA